MVAVLTICVHAHIFKEIISVCLAQIAPIQIQGEEGDTSPRSYLPVYPKDQFLPFVSEDHKRILFTSSPVPQPTSIWKTDQTDADFHTSRVAGKTVLAQDRQRLTVELRSRLGHDVSFVSTT
jgi:hypothetical protein